MFAAASLVVITLAVIITSTGHLLLPDDTENANDGAVEIGKLLPGSTVTIVKVMKDNPPEDRSFIQRMIDGKARNYITIPVREFEIKENNVMLQLFGKQHAQRTIDLIDATLALPPFPHGQALGIERYRISNNKIQYYDWNNTLQTTDFKALEQQFMGNNVEHRTFLLGTDRAGRDLLSRLLLGTRVSLAIGFVAVCISMFLGIVFGTISGFFGGLIDDLVTWIMSIIWAIPAIMLVIAISMALQSRGLWVVFLAVGLTMWVEVARVVRGQVMALKEKLFVESARAYGASNFRIVFRHIMPNMLGSLLVIATVNFAAAIMLEAGLSFLGLGVQPPTPSWGMMVYEGFQVMGSQNSWHIIVFPGMAICLLVLSFNILGNSLQDRIDPRYGQQ